jgi:hypothetical protein
MTQCISYGVLSHDVDLKLIDTNFYDKGVYLAHHLNEPSRFINNSIRCSNQVPNGHFHFNPSAKFEGSTLQIQTATPQLCQRDIELAFC